MQALPDLVSWSEKAVLETRCSPREFKLQAKGGPGLPGSRPSLIQSCGPPARNTPSACPSLGWVMLGRPGGDGRGCLEPKGELWADTWTWESPTPGLWRHSVGSHTLWVLLGTQDPRPEEGGSPRGGGGGGGAGGSPQEPLA